MTTPADLTRFAATLADERAEAREIVASIRGRLAEVWDKPLPEEWKTIGVVRELTEAANETVERNPPEARELAQVAVAVATAIPQDRYAAVAIAQCEGHALRVLGTTHSYLYQHQAALRAFDAAQRVLERYPALGHDEAMVSLARAIALSAMNRHEDAEALLEVTAAQFTEYGDQRRIVKCKLLSAMIANRRGDYELARRRYEDTLKAAAPDDDLHTLAMCYSNLATACIALGDLPAGVEALQSGRELAVALEMPTEVARTDWSIARILLQQGDYPNAVTMLTSVRERFLQWRMIDEAGLAALYMVDALIALDERRSAIALTETVIVDFRTAGLNDRALTALAYLRDLLQNNPAPQQSIDHVRKYLESLRGEPARIFVPLPE